MGEAGSGSRSPNLFIVETARVGQKRDPGLQLVFEQLAAGPKVSLTLGLG